VIRWTTEASDDFEAIRTYIEADNTVAAQWQSDLILRAINQLESFPK
jgi:plasmid stabilization system protein ParE